MGPGGAGGGGCAGGVGVVGGGGGVIGLTGADGEPGKLPRFGLEGSPAIAAAWSSESAAAEIAASDCTAPASSAE